MSNPEKSLSVTDRTLVSGADLANLCCSLVKWIVLVVPLGVAVGSACAGFLWSLDYVSTLHWQHPWLLYLLPVSGVLVGLLYHRYGRSVESGSNLILDEIHEPGAGVPSRIVPLVFLGTLATHLCGGSAGREGTAVQMGGGIASAFGQRLKSLKPTDLSTLLMAGVAGGFSGVFGTPFAGTIFAMEVLAIGRINYGAILPCLVAAILADRTCSAWGVVHTPYHITNLENVVGIGIQLNLTFIGKAALAGILFGLAARLFLSLAHTAQSFVSRIIPIPYLRPALGGCCVIGLVFALGTTEYLGLGVTAPSSDMVSIVSSFRDGGADPLSWFWKIVFTVATISSGFKGGEVTPLFFIGATLGNTLSTLLDAPTDLMAGLGFVAVFGAAANTPFACTVMAIELFGAGHIVYFATACLMAYIVSGDSGIYAARRAEVSKSDVD